MEPLKAMPGLSIWFLSAAVLLVSVLASNPADELVTIINTNRTAHNRAALVDNPGLGCIALQYIKAYRGQCQEISDNKKPADSNFPEVFAPNCGVVATTLSTLTGRIIGCQSTYIDPTEAFNNILISGKKSLEILHGKNHTQVGAAISGTDGGGPYFWCVLFSGGNPNATFLLEKEGVKITTTGCFSGNNDDCSSSVTTRYSLGLAVMLVLAYLCFGFGL